MAAKLSKFNGKLSYSDLTKKLNALENSYTELLGPRETWSSRLKDCFSEIRMNAIIKQTPVVEDLERQYESRNSREMD